MIHAFVIRALPEVSTGPEGRYEFRVWPRSMPTAIARLQATWPLMGADRRADIYLVTPQSPETLVKLRGGQKLEIKQRGPDLGALQFWTGPVSDEFPLGPRAFADLMSAFRLHGGLSPDAALSPAHLLAELSVAAPAIAPVTVRKARLTFRKGTCRAEICRASVHGRSVPTLALEDPDPVSARAAVGALGLDRFANVSYGDILCPRSLPRTVP